MTSIILPLTEKRLRLVNSPAYQSVQCGLDLSFDALQTRQNLLEKADFLALLEAPLFVVKVAPDLRTLRINVATDSPRALAEIHKIVVSLKAERLNNNFYSVNEGTWFLDFILPEHE